MSYKYYSTERPVMPGSFPKPQGNTVLDIENFNDRSYVAKIGREAWGFIEYEKPISPVLLEGDSWEYNNATLLPGHGDKSVMMLQQHIQLTDEELYCIRWHMGAFDDKENWNSYGRAVTNFPNVLYTHTADVAAARILGV